MPRSSSSSSSQSRSSTTPLATYFWLILNIGLYGWYHYRKVDPSKVAINGDLLANGGDFGRALSGSLAHFEIWHLGFNAMSLYSSGEALETSYRSTGSSIGMLLWTGSFLILVVLGVVGLYAIEKRFRKSGTGTGFPNLVGFSGVLFTWSAYHTLSLNDYQQTCPIPFVDLCFSTHSLFGSSLRFSWGPILQLLFVQLLLHRRVSFVGHLSGLIVGFLWHWGVLPPLELCQPCVLYPVLWMVCKHALSNKRIASALLGNEHDGDGFATSGGSFFGGGVVLGSSGIRSNRWSLTSLSRVSEETTDDDDDDETEQRQTNYPSRKDRWCQGLQKFGGVHFVGMVYACRGDGGLLFTNGMVLSELLLVVLFSLFVRVVMTNNNNDHPFCSLGVLGRAYVAFAVVAFVTDSMALGGWWAIPPSSTSTSGSSGSSTRSWYALFLFVLMVARFVFWVLSSSVVCHLLESSNQVQGCGIWSNVLGWSVAEPCASLGRALLVEQKPSFTGIKGTASLASSPGAKNSGGSASAASGRSASNVAGKSRLVDRIV